MIQQSPLQQKPKALYRDRDNADVNFPDDDGHNVEIHAALRIHSDRLNKLQEIFKLLRTHSSQAFSAQSRRYNRK